MKFRIRIRIVGPGEPAVQAQPAWPPLNTEKLAAGSYDLNFSMEGRLNYGANGVNVFVNGVANSERHFTFLPAWAAFNDVSLNLGNLVAGSYAIAFAGQGANGRDVTTFIDNIAIVSSVPDSGGTFLADALAPEQRCSLSVVSPPAVGEIRCRFSDASLARNLANLSNHSRLR